MALSVSAIIVIVVLVSALCVTILWTFSSYYRQTSTMQNVINHISHEQEAYMRQVRHRNFESVYSESVFGSRGGRDGDGDGDATTARTSRVWSYSRGTDRPSLDTPSTAPGRGGGAIAGRMNSYERQGGGGAQGSSAHHGWSEKDGAQVSYSMDEQAEYFGHTPYESNDYYDQYGYEQESPK